MHFLPRVQALRCFVFVARERSVSKAAMQLNLSQPAVSLQLKNLEDATGLLLFDRTPHGLVLTWDGAVLLAEAENSLSALGTFSQTAASLQGAAVDVLRIGTILDPDFIRLGALLNTLVQAAPQLQIELGHGTSDDVLAKITRHKLDVGFYLDSPGNPVPTGPATKDASGKVAPYRIKPLRQFVYRVVAPPGWESRVIGQGWKGLATLPWLATPVASANRRLLANIFGPLGLEPKHVAMTDHEASMLSLLESGVGLSLVRDDIAQRESRVRKLVIADRVKVDCAMSFICLQARVAESAIAQALSAVDKAWSAAKPA